MGYDRHLTVIHSAAAQLTALTGETSRVIEEPGAVRIETDITPDLIRQWPRLLAVLDLGDTYGLTATEAGQTAWLRIAIGPTNPC
ncbi:hypothetical protein [Streptomyces sp. H39-S7]|uniref:hypothetical protein n=1 Tax=Streptomyces sp. H39-S7 TaxID=3004357 RepID=UPI0022AF0F70|nr:hypothetical protein [Streptomyces sp. H39-S7]